MGREVRRVPLSFDWPLNEVWKGFLMPDELSLPPCPDCVYDQRQGLFAQAFGLTPQPTGYSPEAFAISNTFYAHQIGSGPQAAMLAWHDKIGQAEVDNLIAEGRLRTWNRETRTWESLPRTAAEVNEENRRPGLNGHDAINRHILVEFRCKVLGIESRCKTCDGNGEVADDELRAAHEAWERTDPPTGEGWQLWETVSEGSPISPVFDSAEGLIQWLTTDYTWGIGKRPMTREQAEAFVGAGSSIGSFVMAGDGRLIGGAEAVHELGQGS